MYAVVDVNANVVVNVNANVVAFVFADVVVIADVRSPLRRTRCARPTDNPRMFGFQRLDVYRAAAEFLAKAAALSDRVP